MDGARDGGRTGAGKETGAKATAKGTSETTAAAGDEKGVAIVNGELRPLAEASVPLLDRGFLFGHAVFETLLVLEGRLIGWNDHMARLARGCERVHVRMPDVRVLREEVARAFHENARAGGNVARKVSVRIVVTGGTSSTLAIARDAGGTLPPPNVAILCKDAPRHTASLYTHGIALETHPEARSMPLVDVKSTNYLWNLLALEHARARGADDAVFVDERGFLTECTTANFVWVDEEGLLCAMPNKDHCLPGTTLLALSRALRKHGHMINDRPLHRDALASASAAFALSSVRGLAPVNRIGEARYDLAGESERIEYLNRVLDDELLLGAQPL